MTAYRADGDEQNLGHLLGCPLLSMMLRISHSRSVTSIGPATDVTDVGHQWPDEVARDRD